MKTKWKRLLADIIDLIIILLILKTIDLLTLYNSFAKVKIFISLFEVILFILYIFAKDCIFGYESLGKKIMSLAIESNNKKITQKNVLIKRNISNFFVSPFHIYYLLLGLKSSFDEQNNITIKDKNNI